MRYECVDLSSLRFRKLRGCVGVHGCGYLGDFVGVVSVLEPRVGEDVEEAYGFNKDPSRFSQPWWVLARLVSLR